MKNIGAVLGIVSVVLGSLFLSSAVLGQYQIIDLGTLSGYASSEAFSINNNGQIVGRAYNYDNNSGAFYTRAILFNPDGSGNNTDLGTLGGNYSAAFSINNNGQIVGWADNDSQYTHATLFDSIDTRNNKDLGTLGGNTSYAYSINDKNQIVGNARNSFGSGEATLFSTNTGSNIALAGGGSVAYCINMKNQIIGDGGGCAAIFDPTGSGHNKYLGYLSGGTGVNHLSLAWFMNNNSQIIGHDFNSYGCYRAVLFDNTGLGNNIDLGILDGYASSTASCINNKGQIVGQVFHYDNIFGSDAHAVYFDTSGLGNNIDLNTFLPADSCWTLEHANSINDNGWIVGRGISPSGEFHAFLLKPIPEPCTLGLLALGGLAVARRRR
jgi:probable HAF family extracellular repeat protein